jgi:hypothetical protein
VGVGVGVGVGVDAGMGVGVGVGVGVGLGEHAQDIPNWNILYLVNLHKQTWHMMVPLKDKSWIWWKILYQVIDKWSKNNIVYHWYKKMFGRKKIILVFQTLWIFLSQRFIVSIIQYTFCHILLTVYYITINCHLTMLFINNSLYHWIIMIVYYNQCAFYHATVNCIKQKELPPLPPRTPPPLLPPMPLPPPLLPPPLSLPPPPSMPLMLLLLSPLPQLLPPLPPMLLLPPPPSTTPLPPLPPLLLLLPLPPPPPLLLPPPPQQ